MYRKPFPTKFQMVEN